MTAAGEVRRSVDRSGSSKAAERILSRLDRADRQLVARVARRSGGEITELAALRGMVWSSCSICGETMVQPKEMPEPGTCASGHPRPFTTLTDTEREVVIELVASALGRWLADVPIESAIARRLAQVHRAAVSEVHPVVFGLAARLRTDVSSWPTAWLDEVADLEDQQVPEMQRSSRLAALLDDAYHDQCESEATGREDT